MSDPFPVMRDRLDPRNVELMDPAMLPVLRAMTAGERMMSVHRLFRRLRLMAHGGIKAQHPEWTEQQIEEEFRRRLEHGRT